MYLLCAAFTIFIIRGSLCNEICACIVPANSPGIFVYNANEEKDYTYLSNVSQYISKEEKFHLSDNLNLDKSKNWTYTSSLNFTVVNSPVLDQRWENFPNNHDNPKLINSILKPNISNVFFSLRTKCIDKNNCFEASGWRHLKKNNSALYLYNCKNNNNEFYKCEEQYINSSSEDIFKNNEEKIWKIHDYSYTYWFTKENNSTSIIFEKTQANYKNMPKMCIYFYLAMCKKCNMTFYKKSCNNSDEEFLKKEQGIGVWKKIDLFTESNTECFQIIAKTGTVVSKDLFWAIDNTGHVVNCSKNKNEDSERFRIVDDGSKCENVFNEKIHLNCSRSDESSPNNDDSWFLQELILLVALVIGILVLVWIVVFIKNRRKEEVGQSTEHLYEVIDLEPTEIRINNFLNYFEKICTSEKKILQEQFFLLNEEQYAGKSGVSLVEINKNLIFFPCVVDNKVKLKGKMFFENYNFDAIYLQGCYNYKEYIITSHPDKEKVYDFWLMLWQNNVTTVIMISSLDESFYYYWPRSNAKTFGNFEVHLQSETINEAYIHRKFIVKKNKEEREIQQLHFVKWIDKSINLLSQEILPFISEMLKVPHYTAPVVFHCKNGYEKSGIVVLCDIILRSIPFTNTIDIFSATKRIKTFEKNIINTLEHYLLIYLIVENFIKE